MRRIGLSIALMLLACSWAAAESSVWIAQKDNSIIYLGGTSHILRATDYPLPPEFDRAYQRAEVVVFETDIGKLQEPATQQKLMVKGQFVDGSTIDQHLSAKTFGELKAYCDANQIPLQALGKFKPSVLMVMLTLMELMKLGVTQQGVDQYFYALAQQDQKAVAELESVSEQLDYLVSMADGNEDQFVASTLKDMQTINQQFEALAKAWREGDTVKLDALMITELKTGQPELYGKLFTARNRNWLPAIERFQQTPRIEFILVGVGHLVGEDGIIEALKMKGYQVDKL